MGIVAGWGRLSEGGQLPSILQYVSKLKATYFRDVVPLLKSEGAHLYQALFPYKKLGVFKYFLS